MVSQRGGPTLSLSQESTPNDAEILITTLYDTRVNKLHKQTAPKTIEHANVKNREGLRNESETLFGKF